MNNSHPIDAKMFDIELTIKSETDFFKWFLVCLLFNESIQLKSIKKAYKEIVSVDLNDFNQIINFGWDKLVDLLNKAAYGNNSYSTATNILQTVKQLKNNYGTLLRLLKQYKDARELEEYLIANGVMKKPASIFVQGIAPLYFIDSLSHDYETAILAAEILNNNNYEVFIIGGAVRDIWLGREPKDFDLVTNATPHQIMAIPEFKKSKYKDTAQAFGVTRVRLFHKEIESELEIATFRIDIGAHLGRKETKVEFADLESDVLRRDLTINALALDLSTNQVIDYVDGIDDLNDKLIRFIGKSSQRIKEDPLRIMRAIRFKNHLNFSYHPQTIKAIKLAVQQNYIEKIAVDRLRDELTILLIHPSRLESLCDLNEFGILDRVLPEVTAGKGVKQSLRYHAEGDVWQHELLIMNYLPENPSRRLVWAALLHDIGKKPTSIVPHDSKDDIHFYRHYAVGSEMSKAILRRLKFSNRDINDISWMIYNHMSIDNLPLMRPSHQQEMLGNPAFEDLLELHRADAASSWHPNESHKIKPKFRKIEHLWHVYQSKEPAYQQPSLKHDLGIDGHWLAKHFKELDGPLIGKILSELNEWYRNEGVKDKKAYIEKAKKLIEKLK